MVEGTVDDVGRGALKKVSWRLLPFLCLLFFVAYLDRVNVGFAALTMNADIHLSAAAYGTGAGLFFLGYFLLEIPSNLLLARYGARAWLCRILVTWGILSAGMAFVRNDTEFYILRFALGVAEAGFFPGVIFYMTAWFPSKYRGQAIAWFMVAAPVSSLIGSPISGWILTLNNIAGLKGWQLLFIAEGIPAVILGVVTLFYLTERPSAARWLTAAEQKWLEDAVEKDRRIHPPHEGRQLLKLLVDIRVWTLTLFVFGVISGMIGFGLWLPQIIRDLGLPILQAGLVTAIPYLLAAVGMIYWGWHSDKTGDRAWHASLAALLAGVMLIAATVTQSPVMTIAMLSLAGLGLFAGAPPFWSWASSIFSGTASAAGIAFINSFGNLGGFVGPAIFGWVKGATGRYDIALIVLAVFPLVSSALGLMLRYGGKSNCPIQPSSESI